MAISDGQIANMRKRVFLTPHDIQCLDFVDTAAVAQGALDTGATLEEIGTLGMMSITMVDAENLRGYYPVPQDLDPHFDVGFKVLWTMDYNTGTAEATWLVLFDAIKHGGVIAAATTALDTVIGSSAYVDTNGVAATTDFLTNWSNRGIITPATLDLEYADIDAGALMLMDIQMATATAETSIRFLGVQLDYRIHACHNPNVNDSPLDHKGDT